MLLPPRPYLEICIFLLHRTAPMMKRDAIDHRAFDPSQAHTYQASHRECISRSACTPVCGSRSTHVFIMYQLSIINRGRDTPWRHQWCAWATNDEGPTPYWSGPLALQGSSLEDGTNAYFRFPTMVLTGTHAPDVTSTCVQAIPWPEALRYNGAPTAIS